MRRSLVPVALGLGCPILAQPPWQLLWGFDRAGMATAYDSVRQRVVLFGGGSSQVQRTFLDTWEWDGASWLLRTPQNHPSSGGSMAFDVRRQVCVLVTVTTGQPETWEWNGTNWTQRITAVSPPWFGPVAYDEARGVTVLVTGDWPARALVTWEWDGSVWRPTTPMSLPQYRDGFALAYHSGLQRVLLHGGVTVYPPPAYWHGEILAWDGTSWSVAGHGTPRQRHALAHDRARGRLVCFGGTDEVEDDPELFEWDGTQWGLVAMLPIPGRRGGTRLEFDAARGRCLIVGGERGGSEVFTWDGTTLRDATTAGPGSRSQGSLLYDPGRDRMIVWGGERPWDRLPRGLWEWDGSAWQLFDPAVAPSLRRRHGAAFDELRGHALFFGGEDSAGLRNDLWAWDGTTWTTPPAAGAPTPRSGAALAFDLVAAQLLLFGGRTSGGASDETWHWDGAAWHQRVVTPRPSPRTQAALVYDHTRNRTVLYGGLDAQGWRSDTWEWDGTRWTQADPGTGPSGWPMPVLVDDLGRGCVTLVTGSSYPTRDYRRRVYEWRGAGWQEQWSETLQSPRLVPANGMGVAYDRLRHRVVAYGGSSDSYYADDSMWAFTVSDVAAHQEFFGLQYCLTSNRQLLQLQATRPLLGTTWSLQLTPVPVGRTAALLWLGTSRSDVAGQVLLPLSLSAFGMPCELLVSPDIALAGSTSWSLPLCACPELSGVSLFLQGALVDPGANPAGVALSSGLAARLGSR